MSVYHDHKVVPGSAGRVWSNPTRCQHRGPRFAQRYEVKCRDCGQAVPNATATELLALWEAQGNG